MSEREQTMMQAIAKLPAALQDRFLDQVQGAAMAIDEIEKTEDDEQEEE